MRDGFELLYTIQEIIEIEEAERGQAKREPVGAVS